MRCIIYHDSFAGTQDNKLLTSLSWFFKCRVLYDKLFENLLFYAYILRRESLVIQWTTKKRWGKKYDKHEQSEKVERERERICAHNNIPWIGIFVPCGDAHTSMNTHTCTLVVMMTSISELYLTQSNTSYDSWA